jgi:hypothetical protein
VIILARRVPKALFLAWLLHHPNGRGHAKIADMDEGETSAPINLLIMTMPSLAGRASSMDSHVLLGQGSSLWPSLILLVTLTQASGANQVS